MTQNKTPNKQQKYIDLGDRGRYCIHNKLNELTGKEWIIYTKSFKVLHANNLNEFFEQIAEKQITFFTKRNQTVIELLSHSNTMKKICKNLERNYYSIPAKDEYFLGKLQNIDISEIPKAEYLISIPFNFVSLYTKKPKKVFFTDYNKMVHNLVSFYRLFMPCLHPKKYLSVIANNIPFDNKVYPFAFDFSRLFGNYFIQSDEMVFMFDDTQANKNSSVPSDFSYSSIKQHIFSFQFKNQDLPPSFRTLDSFS